MRLWMTLLLLTATVASAAEPIRFLDNSFADFSKGRLGGGGQNIYVSRDGAIRTINRFDINSDGYLDVIFNCTHDTYQMLPASVGALEKGRFKTRNLAVEGSQRVTVSDLNRDGFSDVVICPNAIGVHHDRRFLSIAWGSSKGWSRQRITSGLPINRATRVQVADMNGDRWPDIVVLGGQRWLPAQPEGRIIRIFWGSQIGFGAEQRKDIGIQGAIDIAATDFNQDKLGDLAVLKTGGQLAMFFGLSKNGEKLKGTMTGVDTILCGKDSTCLFTGDANGDGLPNLIVGSNKPRVTVLKMATKSGSLKTYDAFAASHISIGDLDGDKFPDMVLTRFSTARAAGGEQAGAGKDARDAIVVMWGSKQGFKKSNSNRLAMKSAVATAVGDLDGDGRGDITVAVHQGKTTFNGTSRVWLGTGKRQFKLAKEGFRTSGTSDVAFVKPEKNHPPRVVFCNSIGGRFDEAVPVHVYWGSPKGFDPKNVWKIPFQSGYEASCADLNADGYADLILMNSGHAHSSSRQAATLGANIFWGGPKGFDLERRRTVIHEHFLGSSSVADLDRDGHLDLVLEPFAPEKSNVVDQLIIYYGPFQPGRQSLVTRRVTRIPKPGYSQEHMIADLNKDSWLDIAHTSRSSHDVRILWGSSQGYHAKRASRIKLTGALGLSAADLNRDGWLDLYCSTYADPRAGYRDLGSVIFWGGRKGYHASNAQWLPGFSPLGRTIADFDGDGLLDIFSPQHSGELTREDLACHIYWNSKTGFRTRRRTTLFCDSVNDSLAGDFNHDGKMDLAVACHTQHGNHRVFSRVFYNDGRRFQKPQMIKLPTNGTHLMWAADIGNVYTRKKQESFASRVFVWNRAVTEASISVNVRRKKVGTSLRIFARSAATKKRLDAVKWQLVKKRTFKLKPTDRLLQYRAVFLSDNGDRYPTMKRVEVVLR